LRSDEPRPNVEVVKLLPIVRPKRLRSPAVGDLPAATRRSRKRPHIDLIGAGLIGRVSEPAPIGSNRRVQLGELRRDERYRAGIPAGSHADDISGARGAIIGAKQEPVSVRRPPHLLDLSIEPRQRAVWGAAVSSPRVGAAGVE